MRTMQDVIERAEQRIAEATADWNTFFPEMEGNPLGKLRSLANAIALITKGIPGASVSTAVSMNGGRRREELVLHMRASRYEFGRITLPYADVAMPLTQLLGDPSGLRKLLREAHYAR